MKTEPRRGRPHTSGFKALGFAVLVALLSGAALALIEIFGFLPDGNRAALVALWAIASVPVAWIVSRWGSFPIGFVTGFFMVVVAHLLTLLMWNTYSLRNPVYVLQWSEGAVRLDSTVQMYELITIIPVGLLNGFAVGALAWLIVAFKMQRTGHGNLRSPQAASS